MTGTTRRQSSGGGWLCCIRPAVAEGAATPAGMASTSSSSTPKDTMSHGHHVTATAHSGIAVDHADLALDITPGGSDQARKHADYAPASAAAASSIDAVMAAKLNSQNKQDQVIVRPGHMPHPDLKHLLASAHNRPYTDADWDACLAALEQAKAQNQALAMQALQNDAGKALHRSSFTSATSDVFHDAFSHTMSDASVSEAEHREVEQYLAEMEMLRGPAPSRELSCTPTCVPDPPLLFAPKHWKYCQVDPSVFCAYWERDPVRSTPFPLPIDKQMKLSKLAMRCHESIPGMWLRVEGKQLLLTASPNIIAIPGVANYHEYFNLDSTREHWALRRDISLGRSEGQLFMTTDGILIMRVFSSGMFSRTVDWICEDYTRVEDNGRVIITQQWSKNLIDGSVQHQYLVGHRIGDKPPPKGHHRH